MYRRSVLRTGVPPSVGMSVESSERASVIIDNIHPASWCSLPSGAILPMHTGWRKRRIRFISDRSPEDRSCSPRDEFQEGDECHERAENEAILSPQDRSTHLHQNILIEKAHDILLCFVGAQGLFFRCLRSSLFGGGPCKTLRHTIPNDGASLSARARSYSPHLISQAEGPILQSIFDRALVISAESQNLAPLLSTFDGLFMWLLEPYVPPSMPVRHCPGRDLLYHIC